MSFPDNLVAELTALSGVVLAQEDLSATLVEICRIAVRALPTTDGASITTLHEGRPSALGDDEWARGFDELQYEEHEGPCFDAYRTGNVFRIRDLEEDVRWPSWRPRAVDRGARSVISLPMAGEGRVIGALNLYARKPDAFSSDDVSIALIVAGHAGLASQVAASLFQHRDLALNLGEAMRSRATIEQAKGILMGARRCSSDEAFEILVNLSQTSHRKLRDVAEALVNEAANASPG